MDDEKNDINIETVNHYDISYRNQHQNLYITQFF